MEIRPRGAAGRAHQRDRLTRLHGFSDPDEILLVVSVSRNIAVTVVHFDQIAIARAWSGIRDRPWQKITTVENPSRVLAFADTLLDRDPTGTNPMVENNALLDPPYLYIKSGWEKNDFPTTCFRHNDKTNVVFADGHCGRIGLEGGEYTHTESKIGSVGTDNDYYIPDYKKWPTGNGRRPR